MAVLNPFLDSLCNIGLTPGIPKECFLHPQDNVFLLKIGFLTESAEPIIAQIILSREETLIFEYFLIKLLLGRFCFSFV